MVEAHLHTLDNVQLGSRHSPGTLRIKEFPEAQREDLKRDYGFVDLLRSATFL
jgi:hypothetical protein